MGQSADIPPFIFEKESNRPAEPATAGLDIGAGPGREVTGLPPTPQDPRDGDRIAVLQHLFNVSQSQTALDMIQSIKEGRSIEPAPLVIVKERVDDDSIGLSNEEPPALAPQGDPFLDDTEFDDDEDLPAPELTMPTDPGVLDAEEPEVVEEGGAIATEEGIEAVAEAEGGEAPAAEGEGGPVA